VGSVIFNSECIRHRLSAGLRPVPLGAYSALPEPLAGSGEESQGQKRTQSEMRKWGREKGRGERKRRRGG